MLELGFVRVILPNYLFEKVIPTAVGLKTTLIISRNYLGQFLGCCLVMMILQCCLQKDTQYSDSISNTNSKTNVILVVTDDQGYGDLGYHGNPWLKTPNLDVFAAQSLELTNFHVGTTCTPTRAGLMTGRNANRNNAWHTIAGCSILQEDEETMAEVFARNGYQTAMFGKWHLGDNYPFRPHDRGFQTALYHGGGGIGQTPDYWENDYFDDTYFRNGSPEKFKGYCTDVWFNEAIRFLNNSHESPFFLYLATNAAHSPFNVPPEYIKQYEAAPLTQEQKRFYAMISNIDHNFGKLLTYLDQSGLSENTILIFTTDNGTAKGITYLKDQDEWVGYNANLRGTKASHYDGGHRVPFFIRWPQSNFTHGESINELVAHVDLLPTLSELCEISYTPAKPLDGTSVVKILSGEVDQLDRMLVIDTQRNQWPQKGQKSCVMSTQWRLINGNELYNFFDDPGQTNNLADHHPQQVEKMQEFYEQWWTSIEPDFKYALIPVGHEKADSVMLTIHDLHTTEGLPWNQTMIREAIYHPQGHYNLKVVEKGDYRFSLSRYPNESGLTINGKAQRMPPSAFSDGVPIGRGVEATHALVELADTTFMVTVDPQQPAVVFQGPLNQGEHKMSSYFITSNGEKIPAYYIGIKKLDH